MKLMTDEELHKNLVEITQRHALVSTWLPGATWPIGWTLMEQAHADRQALLRIIFHLTDVLEVTAQAGKDMLKAVGYESPS